MNNREPFSAPLPKPMLLICAMLFFACFAAVSLIVLPAALFAPGASYAISGHPVTRSEFVVRAGILFYSMPLLAIYVGLSAYAIYDERAWSRPFLVAYFPLLGVIDVLASFQFTPTVSREMEALEALVTAIFSVVGWWYLYRKRYVVDYYRSIESIPRR
jgi:hypothetical protein